MHSQLLSAMLKQPRDGLFKLQLFLMRPFFQILLRALIVEYLQH
jgi:hypothetical protein